MLHSESIKAIAPAIVAAQAELKSAPKDSQNPFFHSVYADLATCMETLRPALAKSGLAILHFPEITADAVKVETVLLHSSGEWFAATAQCKPGYFKKDSDDFIVDVSAQAVGSAITYLRRYGLAIIGLVTDDDDDGNAATSKGGSQSVKPQAPQAKPAATAPAAAQDNPMRGLLADVSIKTYKDKKTGEENKYWIASLSTGEIAATFEKTCGEAIYNAVGKQVKIPWQLSKTGKKNFYEFAILADEKGKPAAPDSVPLSEKEYSDEGLPF